MQTANIKYDIPVLYGESPLHILIYKDTAIITTAKQGSTYLGNLSEKINGANKYTLTPATSNKQDELYDGFICDEGGKSKLELKEITEFLNGKPLTVKKVLILFRDPYRKLTGGLHQEFSTEIQSNLESENVFTNFLIKDKISSDTSCDDMVKVLQIFQGRHPSDYFQSFDKIKDNIEKLFKELLLHYCWSILKKGQTLEQGHTKPWCVDCLTWEKEFTNMGYNVSFFNLDSKRHSLYNVLKENYKLPIESELDKASNINVREWFQDELFVEFNKSLKSILQYEMRAYDFLCTHKNNITK